MPSVFDLFGTLNLETRSFENSVKQVEARLKATDAQLDKAIATSNRLGDTSATTANRLDKVSQSILTERQRLLDNALAFEKNEISAKQFSSVLVSVDRQVSSLNSRLKDAAARATELSETNLTRFQQQVRGAVGGQEHSLFNLQGARPFQGLGPVFQAAGLRSLGVDETVANVLVVAAREMGIIKVAAEGTAVATTAAAAAESKFSQSAAAAAIAQAEVAAGAEATAVATGEAAAGITILGAGLVPIVAVIGAAVAAGYVAYKITSQIREEAEKRLKSEEAITAEFNKQNQIAAELKSKLAGQNFDFRQDQYLKFIGEGPSAVPNLQNAIGGLQKQFNDNLRNFYAEQSRRTAEADAAGLKGGFRDKYVNEGSDELAGRQEAISAQIAALNARLNQVKLAQPTSEEIYQKNIDAAREQYKADTKQQIDDLIKKAKEYAEQLKQARALTAEIFGQTDNPYLKSWLETEKQIQRVREVTKGLKGDLGGVLEAMIRNTNATKDFGRQISDSLKVQSLKDLANEYRFGVKIPDEQKFKNQLKALLGTQTVTQIAGYVSGGSLPPGIIAQTKELLGSPLRKDIDQQHLLDQQILATLGPRPLESLTTDERNLGEGAANREILFIQTQANRAKQQAEVFEKLNKLIDPVKGLKINLKSAQDLVTIKNEAPNNATVVRKGVPSDTDDRY